MPSIGLPFRQPVIRNKIADSTSRTLGNKRKRDRNKPEIPNIYDLRFKKMIKPLERELVSNLLFEQPD